MSTIITLIGYAARPLRDEDIAAAEDFLRSQNIQLTKTDMLALGEAVDLFVEGQGAKIAGFAASRQLDAILQEDTPQRRKKALLADMESTIIEQEMLEEMAAALNLREKVEDITTRAMNGELDFRAALKERLMLLKGLPESMIAELSGKISFMPGANELVATMKAQGARCVLVSGGFRVFTAHVAKALGFDEERGNILDIQDGKLTGEMVNPVLDKNSKLQALRDIAATLKITHASILAVGDGSNDLPMLKAAGLGIAYHAKPAVQKEAAHNIRFASLRALLFAQGYRGSEIKK